MSAQSSYNKAVAELKRREAELLEKQKNCKRENVEVVTIDDEIIDGTLIDGIEYERCLDCGRKWI